MGSSQSVATYPDINLENPLCEDADKGLMKELNGVVSRFDGVLSSFQSYQGSGQLIRQAISNPSPETEAAAWNVVRTGVAQLKEFFEISTSFESLLPKIYTALSAEDTPENSVRNHQAVVRVLCQMFEFSTRFDDLKMINPGVQNDLAYYRRVLSRLKRENKLTDNEIREDIIDRMSLFYAHASPMTRVTIDTTTNFSRSNGGGGSGASKIVKILSKLAETCRGMIGDGKTKDGNAQQMGLRAMTLVILILDHIHEPGVFNKKTPVDVVSCVKLLQTWTAHSTDGMMNSLRFMTVHARDSNALPYIKKNLW